MGASGVALEIGPVGALGIGATGALPVGRLAPGRHGSARATGQHMAGEGADEFLVSGDRVDLHGTGIALFGGELRHGALAQEIGLRSHCRRDTRSARIERETRRDAVQQPRRDDALGEIMHTQAQALHHPLDRQARFDQDLRQRHRERAVAGRGQRRRPPRRLIEADERASGAIRQREAATAIGHELQDGMLVGGIEKHEARAGGQARNAAQEIGDAQALGRKVVALAQAGIDGNENVVAIILQGETGDIDRDHRIRAGLHGLVGEVAEQGSEFPLVEVRRLCDLESRAFQGLRDKAGIAQRRGVLRRAVIREAHHEGEALARLREARLEHHDQHGEGHQPGRHQPAEQALGLHGRNPLHGSSPSTREKAGLRLIVPG